MLSQTCIKSVEGLRFVNKYATFIAIDKFHPRFDYDIWCRRLAPSTELIKDYEEGKINWTMFTERFKKEISCRTLELRRLAWKAVHEDVYIVSKGKRNPDYRFIVLDFIEELAKREGIPIEIYR